jgi:hypothetical protein
MRITLRLDRDLFVKMEQGKMSQYVRMALCTYKGWLKSQEILNIPGEREYLAIRELAIQIRMVGVNLDQLVTATYQARREVEEIPELSEALAVAKEFRSRLRAIDEIIGFWAVYMK